MIRPTTVLCMIAAFGSGLYLYSEKHRTAMLDRDLGRVYRATQAAHERTGLLRAEWALLNEPGRLQEMADRYLQLHPMAPAQFVQLADLKNHLPEPVANPPEGGTDDGASTTPAASAETRPQADAPIVTLDAPGDAPGDAPAPVPHITPKILAHADVKPHAPQHHVTVASREPLHDIIPHGTPLPLAAPQPVGASYMSAMARPMRQAPRPAIVAAVPSYATAAPYVGSALGGRGSLPPPVPYGSDTR